jgi:hypothetical protein
MTGASPKNLPYRTSYDKQMSPFEEWNAEREALAQEHEEVRRKDPRRAIVLLTKLAELAYANPEFAYEYSESLFSSPRAII